MAIYSHSKLSCYETCPYQYKLKYVDKIKVDIPTTIEAFMGDIVHQTLEKLYQNKKFKQDISLDFILKFYSELWDEKYSSGILIVKENMTSQNYKLMGEEFLINYHKRFYPFEEMTILGLETQDKMVLPDGNFWHVRIDKLGCDKEGNYYVCDYKTNSRIKDKTEVDNDRQLTMYSIWVKNKFSDCKNIKLIWHMLAFDKDIISTRNQKQQIQIQNQVLNTIKEIKEAEIQDNFPRKISPLCNYCVYKSICPSFKHLFEEKLELTSSISKQESIDLVDNLSKIKNQLQELENQKQEIQNKLISFSKENKLDYIYGTNSKVNIKEYEKIVLPEDKKELINLIKQKKLWDEVSMLNYMRLNKLVLSGEISPEIKDKIEIQKDFRVNLSKKD
ncbi:MAG: PD-(D/E)XK nuclease family protein [Bacteroidales bacterium]|jgi:hypothetical protein|nr:PD-(D/E)XK nuclease family protein [Bacteroidales bacterium]